MAPILLSPAMSRTRPTKLTTPPISCRPLVRALSSAPTSKSSRCTRIMASASGHRREDGDLVASGDGMVVLHIGLVHRHAHHREIFQRLGMAGRAGLEPVEQCTDALHLGRRRE